MIRISELTVTGSGGRGGGLRGAWRGDGLRGIGKGADCGGKASRMGEEQKNGGERFQLPVTIHKSPWLENSPLTRWELDDFSSIYKAKSAL